MNINDNGGQAFPNNEPTLKMDENGELRGLKGGATPGMSLRDYCAAAALTGLVGNHEVMRDAIKVEPLMKAEEVAAKLSYRLADAMLKARKP